VRLFAVARQDQRGTPVFLHDSRRGDADDAAMPSVAFDDYAVGLAQRGLCFYALLDVFQDAAFFVLAVGV